MFCTEDDFHAMPYNIPASTDAPEALTDLIPRKEKDALTKVLGAALYNDFINGLFTNGNPATPIAEDDILQKWKDLRDGANYTIGTKEYRYDGVKNFLIPYIFQGWLEDNYDNLSTLGNSTASVENAQMIAPGRRIVKAYNSFSKLIGNCHQRCDTLYGFLNANKDTYSNWNFTDPGLKNTFNF
jgi:hypothetical protein